MVWSLEPYGFLSAEQAPPTVDPSLWRQSRLNMHHGLFEVVPGVYQVRGLDIANMTLIEGDARRHRGGYADLDRGRAGRDGALLPAPRQAAGQPPSSSPTPTPTIGAARAACSTTRRWRAARCRSSRPTCSWSTRSPRTSSPGRRCCAARMYQFGPLLAKGVRGQVDCGLGKTMAAGAVALLRPTDLIIATGDSQNHRRRGIRIPDGAEQRSAGGNAFLHPALQAVEPRGELHAQFPQSAAVPRRRCARRAGVVEISRRSPADVGRQGGCDVRPAPLAGVGP